MQKRDYNPCFPDDIDDVRRSLIFHRTRLAELEKISAAGFTRVSEYKDHMENVRVAARYANEIRLATERLERELAQRAVTNTTVQHKERLENQERKTEVV